MYFAVACGIGSLGLFGSTGMIRFNNLVDIEYGCLVGFIIDRNAAQVIEDSAVVIACWF